MPSATMSVDTTKFMEAVRFVHEHTKRVLPDIINRGALVVIIGGQNVVGAMKRTTKAQRSAILNVPKDVMSRVVQKKLTTLGRKVTRIEFQQLVRHEYGRRVAAIGYTANVGWNNAVIDLGGKGVLGGRDTGQNWASKGYAKKASGGDLTVEAVNAAPAAEKIGGQALQEAIDETATDMVNYAKTKIHPILNKATAN